MWVRTVCPPEVKGVHGFFHTKTFFSSLARVGTNSGHWLLGACKGLLLTFEEGSKGGLFLFKMHCFPSQWQRKSLVIGSDEKTEFSNADPHLKMLDLPRCSNSYFWIPFTTSSLASKANVISYIHPCNGALPMHMFVHCVCACLSCGDFWLEIICAV